MPAPSIEARTLPEHPDCTAYRVTGPSWAEVQRAVEHLVSGPGLLAGHFHHPRRTPDGWQATGYVQVLA